MSISPKRILAVALLAMVLVAAPSAADEPRGHEARADEPRATVTCSVVVNPPSITNSSLYGPLITLNGAVNCSAPMAYFKLTTIIKQQATNGSWVSIDSKSFTWYGSVHKYWQWYAAPCILAYAAPTFLHSISASGLSATGILLSPAAGSADPAVLAGCKGLL